MDQKNNIYLNVYIRQLPDTFQRSSRHHVGIFQTPSKYFPDTFQVPLSHPQETHTLVKAVDITLLRQEWGPNGPQQIKLAISLEPIV